MKHHFLHRMTASVLAFAILFTAVAAFPAVSAENDVIFSDDFSSPDLAGWKNAQAGTVQEGKYVLSGDTMNLVTIPVVETHYAVQSDVSIERIKSEDGSFPANGSASIIIGSDVSGTDFYEFGLGIMNNGRAYAFLTKRTGSEDGTNTILQLVDSIPGTENGKIREKTEYQLKLICLDHQLSCYINDELFTAIENFEPIGSYVGLRVDKACGIYNTFSVQTAGEKQVQSIELLNTPERISLNGQGLNFDIRVKYSGVYGSETISSDADGVTITGLDGTEGQKNLTVKYYGKTASFAVLVSANTDAEILFEEKFDSLDTATRWKTYPLTPENGYGFTYQAKAENGYGIIHFPSDIGGYTNVITMNALINVADMGNWGNYSIETDAAILANSTVQNARPADAALNVIHGAGADFTFRIRANGTAILYSNTTIVAEAEIDDFALGKNFHMKAEVYDGLIVCYYNNERVITYVNSKLSEKTNRTYAGFRAVNGSVRFDNLVVREINEVSPWAAKSITITDANGAIVQSVKSSSLDTEKYLVNAVYPDGSTRLALLDPAMLSGYDPSVSGQQTVTVRYGNASTTFLYERVGYLFYDALDSSESSSWMSTNVASQYSSQVKDGFLRLTLPQDNVTREYAKHISGLDNYSDVAVSADIVFVSTNNRLTRRMGVRARMTGNDCYEFVMTYDYNNGNMSALLYRRKNGQVTELAKYSLDDLMRATGLEELPQTAIYTLTLECIDRGIFLYINGNPLGVYYDNSDDAILSGSSAGYRVLNTSAMIANFCVEPREKRNIKYIGVEGINEDGITVYRGFEINPYDYDLRIDYDDGFVLTVPMTIDMLADYDYLKLGTQQVGIQYVGYAGSVTLNVVERSAYVQAFADAVAAFKSAEEVTKNDEAEIRKLEEQYNSLSGYEVQQLSEDIRVKYTALTDALEAVLHEDVAEYEVIYRDDFNEKLTETTWNSSYNMGKGTWRTLNSLLVNEQNRYGLSDISYIVNNTINHEIASVEADVMLTNASCYASIATCVSEEGYYHARITNFYQNDQGERTYTVQLYKYMGTHVLLAEVYPEINGVEVTENTWYTLRITTIDGMVSVYLNDVLMLQYDDSQSGMALTKGTVGFRALYGDMRFDSLRVRGAELAEDEYVKQIEPTYYEDDFEDETVGENPSHWLELNDEDHWKVSTKADSKVYGTSYTADTTYTWLHTFECDPKVSMRFLVENASGTARVEFLTRFTDIDSYAGIGYDFSNGKWYISTTRGVDFEPRIIYAESPSQLQTGTWHTIEIVEKGEMIQVYVDDELVIQDEEAYMTGYGRIGLLTQGASLYVDDLSYTMVNGGAVTDGVLEYVFNKDVYQSHLEVESLGGDTLIGVYQNTRFLSYDRGQTWVQDTSGDYSEVQGKGLGYSSLLELGPGEHLMVYADDFSVYRSNDYMKTWTKVGQVIPDIGENMSNGQWQYLIHVNSLTKVTLEDGTERIFLPVSSRRYYQGNQNGHYTRVFYSDDEGATWNESENDTRDIWPNYDESTYSSWAEAKVISCADGSLRMYMSRSYASMVYSESHDGGVTWEGVYAIPYMQSCQGSMGIFEDPE